MKTTNRVTKQDLIKFAKENSFRTMMSGGSLDSYNNYIGPDFNERIVVISRGRDSDVLENSNFDVALDMLGGESKDVEISRCSHWACGWIETIIINNKKPKLVKIAYDIRKSMENYPVLDDSDYFEREAEEIRETFDDNESEFSAITKKGLGFDDDAEIDDAIISAVAFTAYRECCSYYGYNDAWLSKDNIADMIDKVISNCLHNVLDDWRPAFINFEEELKKEEEERKQALLNHKRFEFQLAIEAMRKQY
jgi:hypothetical protein